MFGDFIFLIFILFLSIVLYMNYVNALDPQASERLHEKMTSFISKNKAAQIQHSARLVKICHWVYLWRIKLY